MDSCAVTPNNFSQRKIIHVDMDCFYAAVEMLDRPEYAGRPLAVGGSPNGRGVLCTCNYEARKFGLHSAMSSSIAIKKCPQLVIVPPAFSKYSKASKKIREIFERFTKVIEPLSLDEAYLDVTDSPHFNGSATLIAKEIKRLIYEETNLTCSAGVAPNKFLAKVASDWNKPNGLTVVRPDQVQAFVKDLPVGKINGVGKVTEAKLAKHGLKTCMDVRLRGCEQMKALFGSHGEWLYRLSWGDDQRKVGGIGKRKSLSLEHTFGTDLPNEEECQRVISGLVLELRERILRYERRLEDKGEELPPIKNLVVKMKFKDFTRITREGLIPKGYWVGLKDKAENFEPFFQMVRELTTLAFSSKSEPVRLLGLGVRFDVKDKKVQEQNSNQLWLL